MSAEIIQLSNMRGARTQVGHAIRTGEMAYKQLENLHAEGRLPANSVIIDASKALFQKEFIAALRASGAEIILDTKAAELSEIGKFQGYAKGAPWAKKDDNRPLNVGDFDTRSNEDLYGKIARFALENGVTAIMAPTHFLKEGAADPWLHVDIETVSLLRSALDREGGHHIAIDYPLIAPHTKITDVAHRERIMQAIAGLPFDNLIVRLSGFGSLAGQLTTKRTLQAVADLQRLGYPIMLDHIGGLIATAAVAFGFVSGVAHGIGERERFDASQWHKPPKPREPGSFFGRPTYIPVPGLGRSFTKDHINLIAGTQGGRRLVSCQDRNCCPRGLIDMLDKPRAHIAFQQFEKMQALFEVPDTRRAQHFLDTEMHTAQHKARDLAQLKTGNATVNKALANSHKRIDSLAKTFETLIKIDHPVPSALRWRGTAVCRKGVSIV